MDMQSHEATFQHDLEMMDYFQNEFMFRQKHFWDILIKLFTLTVVITILPIASEVLGTELNAIPAKCMFLFPALGFIISFLNLFLLKQEAEKIAAVNEAKYRINRECMDSKYHYVYFKNWEADAQSKAKWLSHQLPWLVFFLEVLIALGVCIIIFLK